MAVTNYALAGVSDETQKKLQQVQQAYAPSAQTTQLQQKQAQLEATKPGAYQQSGAVTAAQQTLANLQANKPQGFNSKYAGQLESIMQQIQNPEKFKYEFNGDNLFKAYADQYTQKGKQAALDVQGQAAALTGGYGNSYGQSVGQQQYQQFLTQLFDRGMELRNAAYQQYQDDQNAIKDRYNVLRNADESEYNRYRDTVGDWRADLENAQNVYNTERNVDYNRYRDMVGDWQTAEEQAYNRAKAAEQMDFDRYQMDLNYWTGLAQIENNAYMTEQERQEAIRQFNMQYELELDKWNVQKAQLLGAMEAEAGGGGGGGGGGSGKVHQAKEESRVKGSQDQIISGDGSDQISKANWVSSAASAATSKLSQALSTVNKALNAANVQKTSAQQAAKKYQSNTK